MAGHLETQAGVQKLKSIIHSQNFEQSVENIKDKDVTVILGLKEVGKSTLTNVLIGNELTIIKDSDNSFKFKATHPDLGPKTTAIGLEDFPSAWSSSKANEVITEITIDTCFFECTEQVSEIANLFYLYNIITLSNSVKFILIVNEAHLTQNDSGDFNLIIVKLVDIFKQCYRILDSVVLAINNTQQNTVKDTIIRLLKIVADNKDKSLDLRCAVAYFIQNPNQIVLFKKAVKDETKEQSQTFADIFQVIDSDIFPLVREKLNNMSVLLSNGSIEFLIQAQNYWNEFTNIDHIIILIESLFDSEIIGFDLKRTNEIRDKLNKLKKRLDDNSDLEISVVKIIMIKIPEIFPNLLSLPQIKILPVRLSFFNFMDKVININNNEIFMLKINMTISKMAQKLKILSIDIQEKTLAISSENATYIKQQLITTYAIENAQNTLKLMELQSELVQKIQLAKTRIKCSIL